jgi:hypothetical protein
VKLFTLRDILGTNLIIANFETRPTIKKCMLLELVVGDKSEDGFGKAHLRIVADLTPFFSSCKGLQVQNYLVLFSNEQTLHVVDRLNVEKSIGSYELQGQSIVKMIAIKKNYFMLFSFRCQLFRITKIPSYLLMPGGPTVKIECLREIINNEF